MLTNITIGSDPEFFVVQRFSDVALEVVPAYEVIPGTKTSPIDFGDGYKVLTDNILAEGNIPPANNMEDFVNNIERLKDIIYSHFLREMDLELMSASSLEINREILSDPKACEFGCAPYKDAWENQLIRLMGLEYETKRPAGFHIHVGYEADSRFKKKHIDVALARAFDFFVINWANKIHHDEFRDEFYGGYGKMRHTSYGAEFRSLSSYFTQTEYLEEVYERTMQALNFCSDDGNIHKLLSLKKTALKTEQILTPVNV